MILLRVAVCIFAYAGLVSSAVTSTCASAQCGHWPPHHLTVRNGTHISARANADPEWIRILPLGASIVRGKGSNPKDGFRKPLRDHLRSVGYKVNMVGSQSNEYDNPPDSMVNGMHEGHEGHVVDQVYNNLDNSIWRKPNLVLLHAGTNDCRQNIDLAHVGDRLGKVVDKIFDQSQKATVIISTLIPNGDPTVNDRINQVNEEYRKLAKDRRAQGQRVVFAEMNDGFITTSLLVDGTHPNNEGHRRMAAVWNAAIAVAAKEGKLQPPEDTGIKDDAPNDNHCRKVPGDARGPVTVQRGSGADDGPYSHVGTPMGSVFNIVAKTKDDTAANGVAFAQLVHADNNPDPSTTLDDIVYYTEENGKVQITMYPNLGKGKFDSGKSIDVKDTGVCHASGVFWGDVNNDGVDDYICIGDQGNMYVSLNKATDKGVPQFEYKGLYHAAPPGYAQKNVRLADIDGDGRLDYCLIHDPDGNIHCWRNAGQGDMADSWEDYSVVFIGLGKGDIAGVRLLDINGDFLSDWLSIGDQGDSTIFTNARSAGTSPAPHWTEATTTHGGVKTPGVRNRIKFGRVYGTSRRDYIYISTKAATGGNSGKSQHDFNVWRNDGKGGTSLKADGNRYCDMTGDGKADYIWISATGELTMFHNTGTPGAWQQDGVIFNANRDRKSLHLADWTGDGKCDLLSVDRGTGKVDLWINTFSGSGKVSFESHGNIDDALKCSPAWGVGVFDLGVRFAQLTGDEKASYLCLQPNGLTSGWVSTWPNGVRSLGQVKSPEGKDRATYRFADVNGDGKDDLLIVDHLSGAADVWYNNGEQPDAGRGKLSGSKFAWDAQGKLYDGLSKGANQYYVDLQGDGRADLVVVEPVANTASAYTNLCEGNGGDDQTTNPDLPAYTPKW